MITIALTGLPVTGLTAVSTSTGSAAVSTAGTWTKLDPLASPTARDGAAAGFDSATKQLVLFGGATAGGKWLDDTWLWTGTRWEQLRPKTSPRALWGVIMGYDEATKQLILAGNRTTATGATEPATWLWTGSNWVKLKPATSPPSFAACGSADDPRTGQLLVHGCQQLQGPETSRDTWAWTGSRWHRLRPATSPPKDVAGPMAFDPATGTVIMSATLYGYTTAGFTLRSETWSWNGANWKRLSPTVRPTPAAQSGLVYDPAAKEVMQFGGVSVRFHTTAGCWTYTASTWHRVSTSVSPPGRAAEVLVDDPAHNEVVMFGGFSVKSLGGVPSTQDDTWVWRS